MPRNSQGLYTLPAGNPVIPNTLIESNWANPTMEDIAAALTGSLPRDGSAPMTGPLTLSSSMPTAARHATTKAYVDQFLAYASGFPIGSVTAYAGSTVPPGYLECNGQAVSRTTYADLFTAIGTTYGAGDASTTFNVPDMRDEFVRGKSAARAVGSKQAGSFASHIHGVSDPGHGHSASQTAHSHTITTGGHNHTINDPGHIHYQPEGLTNGPYGSAPNGGAFLETTNVPSASASTGISTVAVGDLGGSTDSQQPAVSLVNATTGLTIGAVGGTETVPQNIAQIYIIKAVNDTSGSTAMTGITTNDDNMISVDDTNPVVPELVIKSNVAFGIPKLDAQAKVSLAQLPAGVQSFLGTFDASGGQNPTEEYPGNVYLDGDTYLVSAVGTITVYNPNTNVSAATAVKLGWNLVYINNLTQPVGWYYLEAAVVTAAIASQVAFTPGGTIAATNVQTAIEELDSETQSSLAGKAAVGNALPGMDGSANAGVSTSASRQDHIHPTDTSRAAASAETAAGTSYAPQGGIGSTTVQGALTELDSEKATIVQLDAATKGPAFRATQTVQQQINANVPDLCVFATESFDLGNCYSTAQSRFTPNVAGHYQINAAVGNFLVGSQFGIYVALRKNGTLYSEGGKVSSGTNSFAAATVSDVIHFNGTTDYVDVLVTGIAASGTMNVQGQYFSAAMVRPA